MISKNISYKESIRSNTATRLGIDNTPNDEQISNMRLVAEMIFQPLRLWTGGPIKVNSFFRCKQLNTAIGGSKTSQHMKGEAIDIDDNLGNKSNAEMFKYIKDNLIYHQLIWEFGDDDNPLWIHFSYKGDCKNRMQVLRAIKVSGKTKYIEYK
tara:strand:- start:98 stop:556 length:459 start_codon:yes stop_codon:yes gene_type:complete